MKKFILWFMVFVGIVLLAVYPVKIIGIILLSFIFILKTLWWVISLVLWLIFSIVKSIFVFVLLGVLAFFGIKYLLGRQKSV